MSSKGGRARKGNDNWLATFTPDLIEHKDWLNA